MKVSEKKLREVYDGINAGKIYCGIRNGSGIGEIAMTVDKFIGWSHYGSSANDNTLDGLRFVLEVIFEDCEDISEAVWSDYHINYVPTDGRFFGIDRSRSHPNVCGL